MLDWITNSFILMTFTVFLGELFGNIRFGRFSFSTSGSIFAGILLGWGLVQSLYRVEATSLFYPVAQDLLSKNLIDKGFFDLFLIVFIASVGLLAAKNVGKVIKIYGLKFIVLGFMITFIGAVTTFGFSLILPIENPYFYTGVYTGALTSSPGLAASLETAKVHSFEWVEKYDLLDDSEKQRILNILKDPESPQAKNTPSLSQKQKKRFIGKAEAGVGTGYAVGYPFGVIIVIFAMNFFPLIFKIDQEKERFVFIEELKNDGETRKKESHWQKGKKRREIYFDLSAFALVCIIGYFLGLVKISLASLGELGLGSTGGVLISALTLGHIGKVGPFSFRMDDVILGMLRKTSLAYFFAIVGLRFGYQVIDSLTGPGFALVIASIFIGSIAMMSGFLVGRYVFKINWIMLSGAICGGMTSTPGLGAAIDAAGSDDPAAGYGAVYPFALLGMVLFSIILNHIV